jgi:hypothetical protein
LGYSVTEAKNKQESGYEYVVENKFDGFNGDVSDTGTWTYDIGGWGFGNGQDAGNTP